MEGEDEKVEDQPRAWCPHTPSVPTGLDLRGLDEENPPVGRLQPEDVRLLGVVGCALSQRVVHADDLLGDLLVAPVVNLTDTHTHTHTVLILQTDLKTT